MLCLVRVFIVFILSLKLWVGQILDKNQENLFNITKQGKGITHWLKDVSLKSQKEIIAQGTDVSKNLKKLNIAQLSGIAYSAVALGVLLPKLNIWMTKHNKKTKKVENLNKNEFSFKNISFKEFKKN